MLHASISFRVYEQYLDVDIDIGNSKGKLAFLLIINLKINKNLSTFHKAMYVKKQFLQSFTIFLQYLL